MSRRLTGFLFLASSILSPMIASAEMTTYVYDAKGRLVRVVKTGGPDSGATTTYERDKADNRQIVRTTGAPR